MLQLYTPNCTDNHLIADGIVIFLPFNAYCRKRGSDLWHILYSIPVLLYEMTHRKAYSRTVL